MARYTKKAAQPIVQEASVPTEAKVRQEDNRWVRIQATRRRHSRTGEPVPGSLGVAYMFNPVKNLFEKVAVLTKKNSGIIEVQRAVGSQLIECALKYLRTAEELWDDIRIAKPEILPAYRIDPNNPQNKWEPTALNADEATAAFKRTD